jgi:tetratricopeptide (TPR) repeat protein
VAGRLEDPIRNPRGDDVTPGQRDDDAPLLDDNASLRNDAPVGNDGGGRESAIAEADQPVIFVPVEAEDLARRRRRRLAVLWLITFILVGSAGFYYKRKVDPIHAQESYESGLRLLKIARYSQAITAFDRAISLKPDFADAYLMRAKALVADNQTERSFRDFGQTIAMRPNDPQPLLERGAAYIELKDYQAAISDANAALALDTNLAPAYNLRGIAIRNMGNLEGALADFDRAVKLLPDESNYFERGTTYQMLGEHRLAIADFTQMIEFHPDTAAAYFARAKSRRAIGDFRGAERDHMAGRIIDGR